MIKFRFGKIVIFKADGTIVCQSRIVQDYLDSDPKIAAQSDIKNGMKFIALDIKDEKSKRNMIVLEFMENGEAECVGIFNDYS